MNRAQQRQMARKYGWRGSKAKRGTSLEDAFARALQAQQEAEQAAYAAKIQQAAQRTREMGLVIPGQ